MAPVFGVIVVAMAMGLSVTSAIYYTPPVKAVPPVKPMPRPPVFLPADHVLSAAYDMGFQACKAHPEDGGSRNYFDNRIMRMEWAAGWYGALCCSHAEKLTDLGKLQYQQNFKAEPSAVQHAIMLISIGWNRCVQMEGKQ